MKKAQGRRNISDILLIRLFQPGQSLPSSFFYFPCLQKAYQVTILIFGQIFSFFIYHSFLIFIYHSVILSCRCSILCSRNVCMCSAAGQSKANSKTQSAFLGYKYLRQHLLSKSPFLIHFFLFIRHHPFTLICVIWLLDSSLLGNQLVPSEMRPGGKALKILLQQPLAIGSIA